jgi:hypothetical protein
MFFDEIMIQKILREFKKNIFLIYIFLLVIYGDL